MKMAFIPGLWQTESRCEGSQMKTIKFIVLATLLAVSVSTVFAWAWPGLNERGFGEIEALTPFGKPETERVTLPLNPNKLDTEMYVVEVVPIPTVVVG